MSRINKHFNQKGGDSIGSHFQIYLGIHKKREDDVTIIIIKGRDFQLGEVSAWERLRGGYLGGTGGREEEGSDIVLLPFLKKLTNQGSKKCSLKKQGMMG